MRLSLVLVSFVSPILLAACGSDSSSSSPGGAEIGAGAAANEIPIAERPAGSDMRLASDLTISEIVAFQTVKAPLFKAGVDDVRKIPLIEGKEALIRVMVKPSTKDFAVRDVRCVLHLEKADGTVLPNMTAHAAVRRASIESILTSSLNFTLPADVVTEGLKLSAELIDEEGTEVAALAASAARYPSDGLPVDASVISMGHGIKLVIVPVRYEADSSGRLPVVSNEQIEIYRKTMLALYPISDVTITVREAYGSQQTVKADGTGWSALLNDVIKLRQGDRVEDDEYYWGVFAPSKSFNDYCNRGCVAGLSGLLDESDTSMRASIGIGYGGQEAAETMAHEIGHAHGRDHAPCVTAGARITGVDKNFPYSDGSIGVYGWNRAEGVLVDPNQFSDMMGYCTPNWISDYTYLKLVNRIVDVNEVSAASIWGEPKSAKSSASSAAAKQSFRMVSVDGEGAMSFSGNITSRPLKSGSLVDVTRELVSGASVVTKARFIKYDHVPGGILMVQEDAASPAVKLTVTNLVKAGTRQIRLDR